MDGLWEHYAEGNKLEKGKYHTISLTCGILKTKWIKAKQQQQKQPQRYRDHVSDCQRQGVGDSVKWVRVIKRYKPPVIKQMS